MALKFLSYMAPSIPRELFHYLAAQWEKQLGEKVEAWFIETASGPSSEQLETASDPYSEGTADIGCQCAPTYCWSTAQERVELLRWAPVFDDPRNGGEAIYFSDVAVRADSPYQSFEDLRGKTWSYNDPQSLSGYYSTLHHLHQKGEKGGFFGRTICSGSHLTSMELILKGEADGTAIDSNVLMYARQRDPSVDEKFRFIDQIGPHGVQPFVLSTTLPDATRERLQDSFSRVVQDPEVLEHLRREFLINGFQPVEDRHYDREREILRRCENLSLE